MPTPVIDGSSAEESARGGTLRRTHEKDINATVVQIVRGSSRPGPSYDDGAGPGGVRCDQDSDGVRVVSRTGVRRHVHNILGPDGTSACAGE
jgi:hypothetical protein